MQYYRVKDNEDLVRDTSSSAILNTDSVALNSYKAQRQRDRMINQVIEEHVHLKTEIAEIKSLLIQLVGKNS